MTVLRCRRAIDRLAGSPGELVALSVAVELGEGEAPPTAFRIWKAGINPTRKGPVLFDEEAARTLMAGFVEHATDGMIDLEHLSLDDTAPNFDPDARGWFRLEVRNGELWAVDVRWTPDGDARLRQKRQRYISPAFSRDPKTKRPLELVNVAITAMPATDNLTPLVAASGTQERAPMNPKLLALLGLADDADDKAVAAAIAELQKDPAKFGAFLSAVLEQGGKEDAGNEPTATKDDPASSGPAAKPGAGAAGPEGPTPKKVTTATEYHGGRAAAELAREVVALRSKVNAAEIERIILSNRQKFTPALEKWAVEAYADNPDGLRAWLKVQPVLASSARHDEKKKPGSGEGAAVKLTAADLELCKKLNRDPKTFLKHKRELAAADDPEALTALIDEEG